MQTFEQQKIGEKAASRVHIMQPARSFKTGENHENGQALIIQQVAVGEFIVLP